MLQSKTEEHWYFIVASDKSCQGYMPGKDTMEACSRFGMKTKDCKVVEVIKTANGFKWKENTKQLKLLE